MLLTLGAGGVILMVSKQRSCDHRPQPESCFSYSRLGTLCDYVTYASCMWKCEFYEDVSEFSYLGATCASRD